MNDVGKSLERTSRKIVWQFSGIEVSVLRLRSGDIIDTLVWKANILFFLGVPRDLHYWDSHLKNSFFEAHLSVFRIFPNIMNNFKKSRNQ